MLEDLLFVVTLITALGCGLVARIFFAFSTFVMEALKRIPPAHGNSAMQAINITVINPWFMLAFLGTAVTCVLVIVFTFLRWDESDPGFLLTGSLLYLIGTIMVTVAFNVPRNDALAASNPESDDGARIWSGYVPSWTAWNHVRTVSALAAAVLLTLGI